MIVYSTKLKVTEELMPRSFIRVLLEWRQNVDYQKFSEKVIWDTIDMNPIWEENGHILEVKYLEDENIIAALFEQAPDETGLWKTEIVFNIKERTVCVLQHKDFDETMSVGNGQFWAPSIVKYLIQGGYIADENGVPIVTELMDWSEDIERGLLQEPIHSICNVVIQGNSEFLTGLDLKRLVLHLEGIARIFVKEVIDEPNSVTIYHLNNAVQEPNVKIYHGNTIPNQEKFRQRIIDSICRERNLIKIKPLDSWYGVQRKLLEKKMKQSQREGAESKELAEIAVNETAELQKKIRAAEAEIEKYLGDYINLQNELDILRSRINNSESSAALLYYGEEDDIYADEIRTAVLKILEEVRQENKSKDINASNRMYDICDDIIKHNAPRKKDAWDVYDSLDNLFGNYRRLTERMQNEIKSIGAVLTKDGSHYKAKLGGQDRYTIILPCSPSIVGAGKKAVSDIKERWFKK